MRQLAPPSTATPEGDLLADNFGGSFRRVLVPVGSFGASINALSLAARMGHATGCPLRVVDVQMWDPSVPRDGGRFYPETSEEATAVLVVHRRPA